MKRRVFAIAVVSMALLTSETARSHGGGLDANGCHTNRKTGDYHCHRSPAPRPKPEPRQRGEGGSCGAKTKCGEMTSCAEAMLYFEQCGLYRLDGDNDGIPCEDLCG